MTVVGSILIGTLGLTVAAAVSLCLAVRSDGERSADNVGRWLLLGILAHGVHSLEEYLTGFYVRFPELLGLVAWPPLFFVSFNLSLIAVWIVCLSQLPTGRWFILFPIWFLALGSAINGLAHPVLAIVAGDYFPGLITSPVVGVVGVGLSRALSQREAGV